MSSWKLNLAATWVVLGALAAPVAPALAAPADTAQCREQRVVMLGASWCGFCRKARAFFDANSVAYEEIDVDKSHEPRVREVSKTLGVPLISVAGEFVRGFDEARLRMLLCLDD